MAFYEHMNMPSVGRGSGEIYQKRRAAVEFQVFISLELQEILRNTCVVRIMEKEE